MCLCLLSLCRCVLPEADSVESSEQQVCSKKLFLIDLCVYQVSWEDKENGEDDKARKSGLFHKTISLLSFVGSQFSWSDSNHHSLHCLT